MPKNNNYNEIEVSSFKEHFSDIEKSNNELLKIYDLLYRLDYLWYNTAFKDIREWVEEVREELWAWSWEETTLYEMVLWYIMKNVARKIGRVTKYNFLITWVSWSGAEGYEPFSVSVSDTGNYYFGVETLKALWRELAKVPQDKWQTLYGHRDVIWFLREVKLIPQN